MKNLIKPLLESKLKHIANIKKIKGEASTRNFFRIFCDNYSLVAMVYPDPAKAKPEIDKIIALTAVYKKHLIDVPDIKDIIDNHIIIQEDLGDLLAQKIFYTPGIGDPQKILRTSADILLKLKEIEISNTKAVLDTARMKWEMDFFLTHFAAHYLPADQTPGQLEDLQHRLYGMVDLIRPVDTFAHRDYHSRNMLIHKDNRRLYLVDFQDSLVAPTYYDLVSFAFDCYLDLKTRRTFFFDYLKQNGMIIDHDLVHITALQRNIKALGTFGFQVTVRKNLSYKKYIGRTLRHILSNPMYGRFFPSSAFKV
jgi:N-acetylmuramate 1-kinase